jgi:hypothetical protein
VFGPEAGRGIWNQIRFLDKKIHTSWFEEIKQRITIRDDLFSGEMSCNPE